MLRLIERTRRKRNVMFDKSKIKNVIFFSFFFENVAEVDTKGIQKAGALIEYLCSCATELYYSKFTFHIN